MMNYMPILPNFYCFSPLQASSYVAPTPQREMKSYVNTVLLNTISQALRVSLNNYQQQLTNSLNQHEKQQNQTIQTKEKTSIAEKVIEIIICEEEEGEKAQKKLNQISIKNTLKSPLLSEKNTTLTIQIPTDDQKILESKDTCNKKDSDQKKKNRKNNKVNTYEIIIPETDLIETAYLPSIKVDSESLAHKKQQLMNRRVRDWTEFAKCKKERREIRMLGN